MECSLLQLLPEKVSGKVISQKIRLLATRMVIRIAINAADSIEDLTDFDCLVTDTACQIRACMLVDWYDKVLDEAREWKKNLDEKNPNSSWVNLLAFEGKKVLSIEQLSNLDFLKVSHKWLCFIMCRMLTIIKDESNKMQVTSPNNLQKFGIHKLLTANFYMETIDVVQSLMTIYSVEYLQSISKYRQDVRDSLSDKNILTYQTNFTHGTFKNNQVFHSKDRKAASCYYGTVAILNRAQKKKIPLVLRFPNGDVMSSDNNYYTTSKAFIVFDCLAGLQYSDSWMNNQDIETIVLADAAQHPQFNKSKSLEPESLNSAIDEWKRRAESFGIGNSDTGTHFQVVHVRAATK